MINSLHCGHANQSDGNDGKIGAGLFAEGLNIVGTQTVVGNGRKIQTWGTMYDYATGGKYWHAGNDGSGSGLNADLVRGADLTPAGFSVLYDNFGSALATGYFGCYVELPYNFVLQQVTVYGDKAGTCQVVINRTAYNASSWPSWNPYITCNASGYKTIVWSGTSQLYAGDTFYFNLAANAGGFTRINVALKGYRD